MLLSALMRNMVRILRRAGLLISIIIAIVAAAFIIAKTPAFDSFLESRLALFLSERGVTIDAESFDFDPVGPSLTLASVKVEGGDGAWSFTSGPLKVRLHFLRSLSGPPVLSFEADAPRLLGALTASEKEGEEVRPPGIGGISLPVEFERLLVKGASVDISRGEDLALLLNGISFDWSGNTTSGEIAGGALSWRGASEELQGFSFEGERKAGRHLLKKLHLESSRIYLDGAASLDEFGAISGSVEGYIEAKDIPQEWLQPIRLASFHPITGRATFTGVAAGFRSDPRLDLDISLGPVTFGTLNASGASMTATLSREGVTFEELEAKSNFGAVSDFEGSLMWGKELSLEAEGRTTGFDLRGAMSLIPTFKTRYFPVGLSADGEVKTKGTLYPSLALDSTVSARVRDFDVSTYHGSDTPTTWYSLPSADFNTMCVVGREGIIFGKTDVESSSLSLDIPKGKITYREGLWYDTNLTIRDISSVKRYLPDGFEAQGTANGSFGGPYSQLEFAYNLDLADSSVFGIKTGRFVSKLEYDLRDLRASAFKLEGPLGKASGSGMARLTPDGFYSLDISLEGSDVGYTLEELSTLADIPIALDGTLGAEGRVEGPLKEPRFKGVVRVADFSAGPYRWFKGLQAQSVEAEGAFGLKRWSFDSLNVAGYGTALSGSGVLDTSSFDFNAHAEEFDLARLDEIIRVPEGLNGSITVSVDASGTFDSPNATMVAEVKGSSYQDIPIGEIAGEANLSRGDLSIDLLAIDERVRITGGLSTSGAFKVNGDINHVDFSLLPLNRFIGDRLDWLSAKTLAGTVRLEGSAWGDEGALASFSWRGDLFGVKAKGIEVGTLGISASYPRSGPEGDGGLLFNIRAADNALSADIFHPLIAGASTRIEVEAKALTLDKIATYYDELPLDEGTIDGHALLEVGGAASGEVSPDGIKLINSAFTLSKLSGAGFVELPEILLEATSTPGVIHVTAKSEGLLLERASLRLASMEWGGVLNLNGFKPFDLYHIPGIALGSQLNGAVEFEGRGAALISAEGGGEIKGVNHRFVKPVDGSWRAKAAGGDVELTLKTSKGVSAAATFARGQGLGFIAEVENARFADWLEIKGFDAEALNGSVTARVDGAIPEGGSLMMKIAISGISMELPAGMVTNQGPIEFTYANNIFTIDRMALLGGGIEVSGGGYFVPGKEWNVEISGDGDAGAMLSPFPAIEEASGPLDLKANVEGPWDNPSITGTLQLTESGRVKLRALDYSFEDVALKATFQGNEGLSIETLSANFGTGKVKCEGRWEMDGFNPGELKIFAVADNISYEFPKDARYNLDADFLLTGTLKAPQIRGEVRLNSLLYRQHLRWRTSVLNMLGSKPAESKSVANAVEEREGTPFIDIAIRGDENLRVENNLAELDLIADLRVRGYLPDPLVFGKVRVRDGFLRFRGRIFELLRAEVDFLGDAGPGAVLDAASTTEVGQYSVNISAAGPLSDMRIELSSDPPLPRTDIISLLALGTTSENISGEDVTAYEATSFLTGGLQDELESQANSAFGVDQFHIEPAYSSTTQSTVPRITVGKALSDSIYARYGVLMGSQREQEMRVEYTYKPGVLLIGSWGGEESDSEGSFGAEIRFRYTFR